MYLGLRSVCEREKNEPKTLFEGVFSVFSTFFSQLATLTNNGKTNREKDKLEIAFS
jgi:hypothetical protein